MNGSASLEFHTAFWLLYLVLCMAKPRSRCQICQSAPIKKSQYRLGEFPEALVKFLRPWWLARRARGPAFGYDKRHTTAGWFETTLWTGK